MSGFPVAGQEVRNSGQEMLRFRVYHLELPLIWKIILFTVLEQFKVFFPFISSEILCTQYSTDIQSNTYSLHYVIVLICSIIGV